MIGTRTPFRISFAGGGSDLKQFYSRHPGCVVSTSINKYMYIFIHPYFDHHTLIKYSKTELVEDVNEIQHPIVREALKLADVSGVDINSIADIPACTGLGSSCSFTVGLLNALYVYKSRYQSKKNLSELACQIEIEKLKEPIGKQDQYAAAFGGLNFITFHSDERVDVEPIIMPKVSVLKMEENLILFYVGGARDTREILQDEANAIVNEPKKFETLRSMTELAVQLKISLQNSRIDDLGHILHENWLRKKELSHKISDQRIDHYYDLAIQNGAMGGKLLGAGGGGFLLFYCLKENQEKLSLALPDLRKIDFQFEHSGTAVIFYD